MTAVGELVLVLGLLVSAHCEVRARDPEVEEEEEQGGRGGGLVTETPLLGGRPLARTGNRCAFVQRSVQLVPEGCGPGRHVVRDQSPCPSGSPGCHRITYRFSTRSTLCQKKEVTHLVWRCCPGLRGPNCEDKVTGPLPGFGGSEPAGTKVQFPDDPTGPQQQRADPNREQNDHQTFSTPYFPLGSAHLDPGNPPTHYPHPVYHHHHHHQGQNQQPSRNPSQVVEGMVLPYPDVPATLPVPDMMALVLSQLQPILEGFNRSLEHLNRQVGALSQDVSELKISQQGVELPGVELLEEEDEAETELDVVSKQIGNVQRQIKDVEDRLRSQNAQLHFNISSFKEDLDQRLKDQQKMLQVSLKAMNATLAGVQPDQDQNAEVRLRPHADNTALWDAITRLDNMVVNNTVKVDELMEVLTADEEQVRQDLKALDVLINQTARNSQILFMETGLEVEQSKERVLRRVEELAGNLTLHEERLQENDRDIDYLYTRFYKLNLSTDCDCGGLNSAMARLEKSVTDLSLLANENKRSLEENSEMGGAPWEEASDWEPAIEELKQDLLQVQQTVSSERNRTRTLDLGLSRLSGSFSALQQVQAQQEKEMKRLQVSFHSLLQDAVRHSDVLQLLLGEEVLEFLEWSIEDQEAHSIPALKKQLQELQEHERGDREEVPSADQPSSSLPGWPPAGSRRNSGTVRESQLLLLHPEMKQRAGDGSDLWKLEQNVEQLERRLVGLEGRSCSCDGTAPPAGADGTLQKEVTWLKRGLEEHLRLFKNVFSNADELAASGDTLDLDRLWELMKRREKRKRGRGGGERSRREAPGDSFPSIQSDVSLLFVGVSPRSASDGTVTFGPHQNPGRSDSAVFTAPQDGLYLFVLTLDLRPGPAHIVLRPVEEGGGALATLQQQQVKEAGPVSSVGLLLLREGQQVRLEVRGEWAESESNLLAVLLLQPTT